MRHEVEALLLLLLLTPINTAICRGVAQGADALQQRDAVKVQLGAVDAVVGEGPQQRLAHGGVRKTVREPAQNRGIGYCDEGL